MDDHFNGAYSLQSNVAYTANGNQYATDQNGRISEFHGDLSQEKAERSPSSQRNLEGKEPGEDAGHLIAASQGGSGRVDNLVRMDAKVNQRDYRAFEKENDDLMQQGKQVHLDGEVFYNEQNAGNRPEAFMVTRTITDPETGKSEVDHHSWTNIDMSEYQNDDLWAALADDYPNPGGITVNDQNEVVWQDDSVQMDTSAPESTLETSVGTNIDSDSGISDNNSEISVEGDDGGPSNGDGGVSGDDAGVSSAADGISDGNDGISM